MHGETPQAPLPRSRTRFWLCLDSAPPCPTAERVSAIFALSLPTPIIIGPEPIGVSAREGRVAAGSVSLYARDVGQGPPAIVLYGEPDLDTAYLLPILISLPGVPSRCAKGIAGLSRQPPVAGRPQR